MKVLASFLRKITDAPAKCVVVVEKAQDKLKKNSRQQQKKCNAVTAVFFLLDCGVSLVFSP